MIRRNALFVALFVLLFVLGWWVGRGGAAGGLYGNLDLFIEVLQKVDQNYVDPVEPEKLIAGALRGMLRDLDPYSQYLDSKAFASLQSTAEGKFGGIGVMVGIRDDFPTVISPIEGTPAWEAGLRSGDVIVRVEGRSTAGLTVEDVADLLRGAAGTRVSLTVDREGEPAEREFTLTRAVIHTRSVPYAFLPEPGVGYLRLANFSETSGAEVREALAGLRRQGAKSLVLDLRFDPGGLLDQAVDVTEQFVPRGSLIVYTQGRVKGSDVRYTASEAKPDVSSPLVVLVDEGSASAAEIVAGALQDLDRALVIGHDSFGKGSVQSVFPLPGRSGAIKLTTALYYTPSGRSIHRGVKSADSAAAERGDSEGEDPHGAAADSSPASERPRFRTRAGRTVYGGGGITPDLAVSQDSLPPLAVDVERRGLALKFANHWVDTHPGARVAVDDGMRAAFEGYLREQKAAVAAAALGPQRPLLERALRRELARRLEGDAGGARVALEGDAQFQRALEVLRRARAARDVFAALPAPATAPLAAAPARTAAPAAR